MVYSLIEVEVLEREERTHRVYTCRDTLQALPAYNPNVFEMGGNRAYLLPQLYKLNSPIYKLLECVDVRVNPDDTLNPRETVFEQVLSTAHSKIKDALLSQVFIDDCDLDRVHISPHILIFLP